MNVQLCLQLGIRGPLCALGSIWLDTGSVGATSSWAGSYHVLSMGRHYDDYVITGRTISLPAIAGIPTAHPYERLAGKIRATAVTGNIGEGIAAIFARRVLMAGVGDIAPVRLRRPFRGHKSPDYLMRLGNVMPGPFGLVMPNVGGLAWPDWWPVESKARSTQAGSDDGRRKALRQLVAYWALLANSQPAVAGYGLIVGFTYQPPREVRASIILPSNQVQLTDVLRQNAAGTDASVLRDCLHGC